jgi:predicted ABC-type ATPase
MIEQPQLLIIAGPNGAGKSTFSRDFAPQDAFIFDPDKERAKIEARFPDLPDESIHYALNQFFFDCLDSVLKNQHDFFLKPISGMQVLWILSNVFRKTAMLLI